MHFKWKKTILALVNVETNLLLDIFGSRVLGPHGLCLSPFWRMNLDCPLRGEKKGGLGLVQKRPTTIDDDDNDNDNDNNNNNNNNNNKENKNTMTTSCFCFEYSRHYYNDPVVVLHPPPQEQPFCLWGFCKYGLFVIVPWNNNWLPSSLLPLFAFEPTPP